MLSFCLILILVALCGVMVKSTLDEKIKELSPPVTFEILAPPSPVKEKLYCLNCGRRKVETENICHYCGTYKYVTLDALIEDLCERK